MFIRPENEKDAATEIREAVTQEFPAVWRYCLVLSGSQTDADDLAQRTSLRALERHNQFEAGTSPRAWLFRMARNLWINEVRSRAVRRGSGTVPVEDAELETNRPSAEMNIFASEVLTKVSQLPGGQREAVLLVYGEGYSYREAAQIMDVPIGTVMSRLATARKALCTAFPTEGGRDDLR